MTTQLPPSGAGRFAARFPDVWGAYQALGASAATSGPVDARGRRLVKLAMAIGAASEGAVHSHARQAVEEGIPAEEIRQVCILAITTLGFPAAMAAMSWVNDVIGDDAKEGDES
jgi:alkylhydroperoxidase/carboxymuconolactone decarboxylase family protein YurZ